MEISYNVSGVTYSSTIFLWAHARIDNSNKETMYNFQKNLMILLANYVDILSILAEYSTVKP
jgi:hypothetical protein